MILKIFKKIRTFLRKHWHIIIIVREDFEELSCSWRSRVFLRFLFLFLVSSMYKFVKVSHFSVKDLSVIKSESDGSTEIMFLSPF